MEKFTEIQLLELCVKAFNAIPNQSFGTTGVKTYDLASQLTELIKDKEEEDKDTISIKWGVEDILNRAEEVEVSITREQARYILDKMDRHHDCNIGITWETIDVYLEIYGG